MVRKLDLFDFKRVARQCALFSDGVMEKSTIVIQGELCGPGIQRNLLNLKAIQFYVFNIWANGELMALEGMLNWCKRLGLQTVPIEDLCLVFNHSIEWLVERAKGNYDGTMNKKEGIVVRPIRPILSPTLRWNPCTLSVHNPDYNPKIK